MSYAYKTLKVSRSPEGLLTVCLNRPEVRNAFNETVIDELARVFGIEAIDTTPENLVKVIVLRGEGPVFCAGGDLNWMKKSVEMDYDKNLADTVRLSRMFALLNDCPKPVIGAIQGAAIGGGVGLVSICDVAIAESSTQFSLSEVRLGIIPACIGPFVISKIGASHARGLFVSAERFSAARALEIGLIHEICASQVDLEQSIERVVKNILQAGPQALSVAKKLVLDLSWPERRARMDDPLEYVATVLAKVRVSPEGQEGVRAFLEKRKPNWLGS